MRCKPRGHSARFWRFAPNTPLTSAPRLRKRIYEDVIPGLAESIAEARSMTEADRDALDHTYQMALTVLFRLICMPYAEDKGLLP